MNIYDQGQQRFKPQESQSNVMYHSMYYCSHFHKQIFVMLQSAITADLEIKEKNLLVST